MAKYLVLYDGECPMCRAARDWLEARIPSGEAAFLACQDPERAALAPAVTDAACMEAMQLVLPSGETLAGARAFPALLRLMPRWRWAAPLLAYPPGAWAAPAAYRAIARRRMQLSGLFQRKADGGACAADGTECGRSRER